MSFSRCLTTESLPVTPLGLGILGASASYLFSFVVYHQTFQVSGCSLYLESRQPCRACSPRAPPSRLAFLTPKVNYDDTCFPSPQGWRGCEGGHSSCLCQVGASLPLKASIAELFSSFIFLLSVLYQYIASGKCVSSVLLIPLMFLIKQPKVA